MCVTLDSAESPEDLWWLSEHGIYRPRDDAEEVVLRLLPKDQPATDSRSSPARIEPAGLLLHHKYKLPCHCFGYVGDASDPSTWMLPFCHADGTIDGKRLPKAIQAILTNYRGTKVHGIPRERHSGRARSLGGGFTPLGQDARSVGDPPQCIIALPTRSRSFDDDRRMYFTIESDHYVLRAITPPEIARALSQVRPGCIGAHS